MDVVTQSDTAQAASAQNARQLDRVLETLRTLLGPDADIRTTGCSLSPDYRYQREGGEPSISGYTATNVVQVTLVDLTQVGRVIDLVTPTGANRIDRLQFMLENEDGVRAQALREAARRARAEAEVLAGALGVTIARVLLVQEGEATGPEMVTEYRTAALASPAPTPMVGWEAAFKGRGGVGCRRGCGSSEHWGCGRGRGRK